MCFDDVSIAVRMVWLCRCVSSDHTGFHPQRTHRKPRPIDEFRAFAAFECSKSPDN